MAYIKFKLDKKGAIAKLAAEMIKDGLRLLKEAYLTADFESETGNLFDSFGCAVYYNGELWPNSISTLTPTATTPKEWYGTLISGEEEIEQYLRNYRPRARGLTLVLAAAMPYYSVLEAGGGKNGIPQLTRKYKVITGANALMRDIARKYQGKFGGRRKQGTTLVHLREISNE